MQHLQRHGKFFADVSYVSTKDRLSPLLPVCCVGTCTFLHVPRAPKRTVQSQWGPVNVQTKAAAPVTEAAVEYIIASWMMGNEGRSAVFMGPVREQSSMSDLLGLPYLAF